jgi:hypothetical protein
MSGTSNEDLESALAQIDRVFGKGGSGELAAPASITEHVARVLCRQSVRGLRGNKLTAYINEMWQNHIEDAQEVFSAMSRPTDEMLNDAEGWQPKDAYQDLRTAREQITFLWGVMIDCAEAELSEEALQRKELAAEWEKLSPDEQAARWSEWEAQHGRGPF